MSCATEHGPTVVALSAAVTAVENGTEPLCNAAGMCPTEIVKDHGIEAVEDSVFCDIMCCCRTASGTGARQRCVQETLDYADAELGYQSRYKAEISYNMMTPVPTPIMRRDGIGHQRSGNWQYRARTEIENYRPKTGMVRRPDIVVVSNPNEPPTQDNIERIVEMKFQGDPDDLEQTEAYGEIAGDLSNAQTRRENQCNCSDDNRQRIPFPVPVPAPQGRDQVVLQPVPVPVGPDLPPVPAPEPAGPRAGTWVIIGLGVATVAAALIPFDGPAGEAAFGSAFVAALGANY